MNKSIKKCVVIFIIYIMAFTGCATQSKETIIDDLQVNSIQAYNAIFEKSSLRTYINVYETELFYMEIIGNSADFYIYDFATENKQKISTVSNFALKGRSNTLINDTLYFYISIYNGNELKNVLYGMNYTEKEMYIVSENIYTQRLIPIIGIENQVVALQGNTLDDGVMESFFEVINDGGNTERVELQQSDVDCTRNSISQSIVCFDGDGQYLYFIEKNYSNKDTRYFLTKYDLDFNYVEKIDITDFLKNYEILHSIGMFNAFGNYFCITDYSGNSILCEVKNGEVSVILSESDLEYVVNSCENLNYEFFYIRNTNEIYRLDVKNGKLEKQNYNLENESSDIRCVLSYGNVLLIIKNSTTNDDKENLYLIPCDNIP